MTSSFFVIGAIYFVCCGVAIYAYRKAPLLEESDDFQEGERLPRRNLRSFFSRRARRTSRAVALSGNIRAKQVSH